MAKNRLVAALVVLLSAIGVLVAGLVAPKQNWDMVAYVAAAHQADGWSGEALRRRTFADVRGGVDPAAFRELTEGPYRGVVARDPASLEQQLPFYTIRVAYIAAVRAVGSVGGSYTRGAHVVAALFGFLSVLAMGALLMRVRAPAFTAPLLVSPLGMLYLARIATPDSMACFASLGLVLLLFRPSWGAYALVAALPAIRSDYLIFSALAAAYLFATHRRAPAAAALAAAALLYLALGRWSGNYGYLNLLNFTLFGQRPYPATLPIETDPAAYAAAIATNVNYLLSDGVFLLYALALATLWFARRSAMRREPETLLLLALPIAFATAHFALFPSYDKRFLVSSFALMAVGVLRAARSGERGQVQRVQQRRPRAADVG